MAYLNFKCKKCSEELDFEKQIVCNNCGQVSIDELELTELGQTLVSELYFMEEE